MTTNAVAILGIGMMTPVGLNAAQTAKSVRARISRIQESPFIGDRLSPFRMGYLDESLFPPLKPNLQWGRSARERRLLQLGAPALKESVKDVRAPSVLPLFLCLPTDLPGRKVVHEDFLACLAEQSGVDLDIQRSQIIQGGRAGFFTALEQGINALQDPRGPNQVIVGGLDSYFDPWVLSHYRMYERRVLTDVSSDGFLPGEGAGFLLLGRSGQDESQSIAWIQAVGLGQEKGHLYSSEPYTGDGLSQAFTNLFQNAPLKVRTVWAGVNGEHIWAKEWGVSQIRHASFIDESFQMHHPAECFGDAGAATPAILASLAALSLHQDHLSGPSLVFASSDGPERGAALLTASASC